MNLVLLVLPAVIAVWCSYLLTPVARLVAFRLGAIDHPGERKVHTAPIARLGGAAVIIPVVVLLVGLSLLKHPQLHVVHGDVLLPLLIGLIPIFLVSAIDDIRPLGSAPKFAAHLLGASIAVALGIRLASSVHLFGAEVHLGWVAVPLSVVWIAGLTNAFNIVDGLDGLSAGLALISSISLAGVSVLAGRYEMASAALVLAGALIGFLPYNAHPAKIFLGDTGSASIGFLLACFALRGGTTLSAGMAILVPMVVVGVPLAETTISMLRRIVRRLEGADEGSIFAADRRHFHHRLLDLGIDHRRAVLLLYGAGVLLAAGGVASIFMTTRHAAVLLVTLIAAAFIGIGRLGYDEFSLIKKGYVLRIYDVPMLRSTLFVVFVDIALAILAVYASIVLKYDDWALQEHRQLAKDLIVLVPAVLVVVFSGFRLYRGAWRLASVEDFVRASAGSFVAVTVAGLAAGMLMHRRPSLTFVATLMLVFGLFVLMARASFRFVSALTERRSAAGQPVLIYGAGAAGIMVLRELLSNPDNSMQPIGFIDDDPRKAGRVVQGFPVFGTREEIGSILAETDAQGVIISSNKIAPALLSDIERTCVGFGVWIRVFRVSLDFRPAGGAADGPRLVAAELSEETDGMDGSPVAGKRR